MFKQGLSGRRWGIKMLAPQNSLAVQWIGLLASPTEGTGLIPSWGTKIPHAGWCGQKKVDFFFPIYQIIHQFLFYSLLQSDYLAIIPMRTL